MLKVFRFVLLAAVLAVAFLPLPAHATFNTVCYLTSGNLAPIRMQADADGGVTFISETANGDGRFFQIRPAGGHWEISSMHNLPGPTSLELDSDGYPIVHQI
jgi:hypothetical protein